MIGEAINGDDGCQAAKIPLICVKVGAEVMSHLMTLVGEECGGSQEEPPIRIRGGIIDVTDGGERAAKGHHPEDHGAKSRHPHNWRWGRCNRRGSGRRGSGRRGWEGRFQFQLHETAAAIRFSRIQHQATQAKRSKPSNSQR